MQAYCKKNQTYIYLAAALAMEELKAHGSSGIRVERGKWKGNKGN